MTPKTNKQKKLELQLLLTNIVNQLAPSMPKGIPSLVKAIVKQIDENEIDNILNGIKDFLANAFEMVERIQSDEEIEKVA